MNILQWNYNSNCLQVCVCVCVCQIIYCFAIAFILELIDLNPRLRYRSGGNAYDTVGNGTNVWRVCVNAGARAVCYTFLLLLLLLLILLSCTRYSCYRLLQNITGCSIVFWDDLNLFFPGDGTDVIPWTVGPYPSSVSFFIAVCVHFNSASAGRLLFPYSISCHNRVAYILRVPVRWMKPTLGSMSRYRQLSMVLPLSCKATSLWTDRHTFARYETLRWVYHTPSTRRSAPFLWP